MRRDPLSVFRRLFPCVVLSLSPLILDAQCSVAVDPVLHAGGSSAAGVQRVLPAGQYRVRYVSGCYRDCASCSWSIWPLRVSSGGSFVEFPNLQSPSQQACEATYAGSTVSFFHAGGPMSFWIFDSASGNNVGGPIHLEVGPLASFSLLTTGCPPGGTQLVATLPIVGSPVSFGVTNAPTCASMATVGVGPLLPIPLSLAGTCDQFIDPQVLFPLGLDAAGNGTFTIAISTGCGLAGVQVGTQAVVFTPTVASCFEVTNGVGLTLGF